MILRVYKDGLRRYDGEPTDKEISHIKVCKKLNYKQVDDLKIGSIVYVTDTCNFPFYIKTSGLRVKISSDEAEKNKWGLKMLDDDLFWSDKSVLDGRIEVYSLLE